MLVGPGIYPERLSLNKSVVLQGEGRPDDIVIVQADADCVTVTGGEHQIRGLTIEIDARFDGSSSRAGSDAVAVTRGSVRITACRLRSAAGAAVFCTGRDAAIEIDDSELRAPQAAAVYADSEGHVTVRNTVITEAKVGIRAYGARTDIGVFDCTIAGMGGDGVTLDAGAIGTIERTVIEDSDGLGVGAERQRTRVTLRGGRVRGSRYAGVEANRGATADVEDCSLADNSGSGLYARHRGSVCLARRVELERNGTGAEAREGGRIEIGDSRATNNRYGGLGVHDPGSELVARDVELATNQAWGIMVKSGGSLILRHATVTDSAGPGILAADPGTSVDITASRIARNHGSAIKLSDGAQARIVATNVERNTEYAFVAKSMGTVLEVEGCEVRTKAIGIWTHDIDRLVVI